MNVFLYVVFIIMNIKAPWHVMLCSLDEVAASKLKVSDKDPEAGILFLIQKYITVSYNLAPSMRYSISTPTNAYI